LKNIKKIELKIKGNTMIDSVRWVTCDNEILDSVPVDNHILNKKGYLRLIDQTLLPLELKYICIDSLEDVYDCIKRLVVRGAPAIGCAAALGLAAIIRKCPFVDDEEFMHELEHAVDYLASSRPTAVNLEWALTRCVNELKGANLKNVNDLKNHLLKSALAILEEDILLCRKIGENGLPLIKKDMGILTHCNAGALATGDFGTALAPIYRAFENKLNPTVYSDETRPLLQGSRLTAWELMKAGVNVVSICDNMAAQVMKEGKIDIVIVGADRIAANGDAANKIGTYALAILADYHKIPFFVAAPYSTIDNSLVEGSFIPIEQRGGNEIRSGFGKLTAPEKVSVYNPAFDVTPNDLITGIITEKGILTPPYCFK
jgi:methylthioribose-1-phosphate isomerase